jgi:periplasmic divalent cation tolerance protein
MTDKVVVLVTCGTQREASRIAKELVGRRLAACVNRLETPVRSTYRWKGKIETAAEYLLLIKTSKNKLRALRAAVERLHSYEVPEVIALPIVEGSATYLRWLGECLRPEAKTGRGGTQAQRRKK